MKRKVTGWQALIGLLVWAAPCGKALSADVAEMLKTSGKNGGICLVVGAKDLTLARSIAGKSAFYVQVLQPDATRASAWGAEVVDGELREKIGVTQRAFDPGHYGSCLLNLVVAQTWKSIANGGLDELKRILTPGGTLAVPGTDGVPPDAEIERAGLKKITEPSGWVLLRKPKGPVGKFGPSDSLRWRSGSRYQRIMYHDFQSVTFGDGKLVYRETMAAPKGGYRFELVCRDAYNGRVLWRIEEPPFSAKDWSSYLRSRMGIAIAPNGRIYTGLGKDFVCLDSETGKVLSVVAKDKRPPGAIRISKGKHVLAGGSVFEIESGKKVGAYGGGRGSMKGDVLFTADGRARVITAYQMPDGKKIWQVNVEKDQPKGQFQGMFCSATALHIRRSWPAASLSSMDTETGKTLWTWPPPPRPKVRDISAYAFGEKLYIGYNEKEIKDPRDFTLMEVEAASGKVLRKKIYAKGKKWAGGCWGVRKAGDYLLYHHNLWFNTKTMARTYLVMFRPKCAQGPLPANGMIYGFPGRKAGAIKGIAALAPRDIEFDQKPGGKVLTKLGPAPEPLPLKESDWPRFRGDLVRGNATTVSLGKTLAPSWGVNVGLGGKTYGVMDSERTGLSQPTVAWGMVFLADIGAGRIVALNEADGEVKWSYHVGSRVDFSPTLHDGLCLFGAKDGWVYALDARTGKPVYKLLVAPRERYIGGREKLESMWPTCGDVFVVDGVAYASAGLSKSVHGGIRVVAFKPGTGEVIWSKCLSGKPSKNDGEFTPSIFVWNKGRKLLHMNGAALDPKTGNSQRGHRDRVLHTRGSMEDWLSTNNLNRLSEDMGKAHLANGSRGAMAGRLIAFGKGFEMGFSLSRQPKKVFHTGTITLSGRTPDGKTKWGEPTNRLNIDDLLVTADGAYCVGHYESGGKPAELRVISRQHGKVLATHEIKGFPTYNGMCAAGKKLFIATREGKLICFEGK